MEFELKHEDGKLFAVVTIDGKKHEKEITDYFLNPNPHDDWLDHKIFSFMKDKKL